MKKKAQGIQEAAVAGMRRIKLTKPGAIACGPYRAGVVVEVAETEARRLVEAKGFEYVD